MPADVVTCGNCHLAKNSNAPALTSDYLTGRRSRRHGPPSVYDHQTFCRVLRTGVDAVYILVDHTMPVYELNDAQCRSLWDFLRAK